MNFKAIKPPTRQAVRPKASQLKYFSKNALIGCPNFHINKATRKNLAPLLIIEAIMNTNILCSNTPAVTVKTL
jgi:hypothetical protein